MVFSKLATGLVDRVQRFFTSPTTIKVVTQSLAEVMSTQTHTNPLMAQGLSSLTPLSYLPTLCPLCFTQWLIVRRGGDGEVDKPCCNCGKILKKQREDSRGFGDQGGRLCGEEDCLAGFKVNAVDIANKARGTATKLPWCTNVSASDGKDNHGFRSWQPIGSTYLTQQAVTSSSMMNMLTSHLLLHTTPTPDFHTCPLMAEHSRVPQPKLRDFQWTWISIQDLTRTRFIGEGSYGEVSLCRYNGQRVVVKTFNERNDFGCVLYEADVGAMMSVLGVGPPIVGMLRPEEKTCDMPGIMWKQLPKTQTMADVIRSINHFKLTDIINMLSQVARLLRVMHSYDVIHNDIKPNNIIITANPLYTHNTQLGPTAPRGPLGSLNETHKYRVYLIDFGNATYREGYQYILTEEEQVKYQRAPYLSPEARKGVPTTVKSDVWSLGHLLQLTGEYFFDPQLYYQIDLLARECRCQDPAKRPIMAEVERRLAKSESKFL